MAAQDTAVHEIDVLCRLLDDEIASAPVVTPRATSKWFAHLKDPQIMLFETANGVRIDPEVFVNCRYGYDIQCETVGEEGLVRLPDPAAVGVRTAGHHEIAVSQDWQGRVAGTFDTVFREWVAAVGTGSEPTGPSAWLLEADGRDHRRARMPFDELGVQRPSRPGRRERDRPLRNASDPPCPGGRKTAGARWERAATECRPGEAAAIRPPGPGRSGTPRRRRAGRRGRPGRSSRTRCRTRGRGSRCRLRPWSRRRRRSRRDASR